MEWFWSKKEKRQPRKLFIPESRIEEVLIAADRYCSLPRGQDHLARHSLWKILRGIFPELSEGQWSIGPLDNDRAPYIIEILEEE